MEPPLKYEFLPDALTVVLGERREQRPQFLRADVGPGGIVRVADDHRASPGGNRVGHWAVLDKLNERAGDDAIAGLVEWALPIQERHLETVRTCSLELAGKEDPDAA